jgi:hypothetical protein
VTVCNLREPLKIAFVTRTSEIFVSEAEVKNRCRRSFNYVEDDFWPITMLTEIAAVRSKNEFLEVPLRVSSGQRVDSSKAMVIAIAGRQLMCKSCYLEKG